MDLKTLIAESEKWTRDYMNKNTLGANEELQMLASAYSLLFLSTCAKSPNEDLSQAHEMVAQCLERANEPKLAGRHRKLAKSYQE